MRRLARHVDGGLARRAVDVGDATACLQRCRVAARIEGVQPDNLVRLGEGRLRGGLVARLPVVDVVVLLVFLIVADQRGAGFFGLLRARHRRQDIVFDDDRITRVLGLVLRISDDRRDLLALEADLVGRQHRLRVVAQSRHPRELVLRHQLTRDHGDHAGHPTGSRGVDRLDARVCVRAAQDRHVQHSWQLDVIEVVALAADEAAVLLALDRFADAAVHVRLGGHYSPPAVAAATVGRPGDSASAAARSMAACLIALTMFI